MSKLDPTLSGWVARVHRSQPPANDNVPPSPPVAPPPPPLPPGGLSQPNGPLVDLRQRLAGPLPCLTYDEVYFVEATTWGLDSGYVPPPCRASRSFGGSAERASERALGLPSPPVFVRRGPRRPFRLFDEPAP